MRNRVILVGFEYVGHKGRTDYKMLKCPMCASDCGRGMGSGRIYMLHHTVGCKVAKLYY